MRYYIVVFIFIFSNNLKSQNQVSIYCRDFTLNDSTFKKGNDYRKVYESVLLRLESPPVLVERDKVDEVFEVIQDEKNLKTDFNQEDAKLFKILEVDYLIFADFVVSPLTGHVEFLSECVRIDKENTLLNIVFPPIRFSEKEFSSSIIFELRVKELLSKYSFTEDLGVVSSNALKDLQNSLAKKDIQINELETKMKAITDYSDIAELNMFGATFYMPGGGSLITQSNNLITEMSKVFKFEKEEQRISLIQTNEALDAAKKAIQIEPRFPFSYYAVAFILKGKGEENWVEYADKAINIYNYTTILKGCNSYHPQFKNKLLFLKALK